MGILNATPDSFSDGGRYDHLDRAIEQARLMIQQGADILDIGGESTRPGSVPVSLEEELKRTIPLIQALRKETQSAEHLISIDTSKPEVAKQAVLAGADIINDVTGFSNPHMVKVAADCQAGLVCMHMQGTPDTMQQRPHYDDVIAEIRSFFQQQLTLLTSYGIAEERICFDPGIGFGKTLDDNLTILRYWEDLRIANRPLLLGLSKKSFIAKILEQDDLALRSAPTTALTAWMATQGANIHRVHDVKENSESLRMMEAIQDIQPKTTTPTTA